MNNDFNSYVDGDGKKPIKSDSWEDHVQFTNFTIINDAGLQAAVALNTALYAVRDCNGVRGVILYGLRQICENAINEYNTRIVNDKYNDNDV
ncbi:MAG: hypothetical protein ACP5N7_03465 [Candidatus Pacearchaeota archaeon]